MKLVVAGSRDFNDKKLLFEKIDLLRERFDITEIISGTAKGADSLGAEYGSENEIPVIEFPANWNKYGKGAGHIRNKQMADYCDLGIIFWDGASLGTKNMIITMKNLNKKCYIIRNNDSEFNKGEW